MNFKGDWDTLLWNDLGMPKDTIIDFIKQRPEFQEDAFLTKSQKTAVKKLKPFLRRTNDRGAKHGNKN